MAYIKNTWVDQEVERPRTYQKEDHADGSFTLIDDFGLVSELGTPVNADNMNHIEEGIGEHEERITALENLPNDYVKKSGDTMTGILYIEGGTNTHIKQISTEIETGVTPAEHQYINFSLLDKNQVKLGELYYRQGNDGSHYIALGDYQGTAKRYLQVGENADGTPYFNFPKCTTKATTTSSANSNQVAVITKNYKSGTTWYRVWSDGWIEQGGKLSTSSNTTVTFSKAFSDTNYNLTWATTTGSYASDTKYWNGGRISSKTKTNFVYYTGQTEAPTVEWRACGY